MRPGELYFLLVPSPAGLATFFTRHDWLTAALVVAVLAVAGVVVRLAHVLIGEIKEKGFWEWRKERLLFLETRALSKQKVARINLEGEQQRRELKRRGSSWWDQLRLFR